jgi:hypothetical protein
MIDDLHAFDLRRGAVNETPACDGRVVHAPLARFCVAPVDQLIRREVRVEGDVEEPALTARIDIRETGDRCRQGAVGTDDPEATRLFGYQDLACRQKGHAPRVLQAFCNGHDIERHVALVLWRVRLAGDGGFLVRSVCGPRVDSSALRGGGGGGCQRKRQAENCDSHSVLHGVVSGSLECSGERTYLIALRPRRARAAPSRRVGSVVPLRSIA